jgi:hypothetical protein
MARERAEVWLMEMWVAVVVAEGGRRQERAW